MLTQHNILSLFFVCAWQKPLHVTPAGVQLEFQTIQDMTVHYFREVPLQITYRVCPE
jgi:hypothetical protein